MRFETLEQKCNFYRSLTDYRLLPNSHILVMVDGHKFSSVIKKKFKRPFDDDFIRMMNEVAIYLCENIQGAKFAYVQSDEISVLITDFDTPETDSYFGFRLCKLQSLIASMATAKFNQLYAIKNINEGMNPEKALTLCTFDCKAWTVPNANDAYAWFLYRQNDCIKNSKSQTAQSCCSYKELLRLTADEMIQFALEMRGVKWEEFSDDKKFGRIIRRVPVQMEKDIEKKDGTTEHLVFTRQVWTAEAAPVINTDGSLIRELIG